MELRDLEVYKISRELSTIAWNVYCELKQEHRFVIGSQFLESIDSVGANIAEGYGRYHYLDTVKFYYNARGSLWEFKHWVELLKERSLITANYHEEAIDKVEILAKKLNNLISATKSQIKKKS
jgi:four helix bundle protein